MTTPDPEASVTIFTTAWCGSCRQAKRFLDDRAISYREIDIESDPAAAALVEKWARGYRTVPTFVIGDRVIVDWDRKAVENALAAVTNEGPK